MQQHTGQHLLSAVLEELFKIRTVSFHLGTEVSTIDVDAPSLTPEQLERAEERCAEVIAEARPVQITFEDASAKLELRKASERTGTLRIVTIDKLDRSACGGTHVNTTAEIRMVLTGKSEKIRGTTRLEFVCGNRALRRARADYRLLAAIGRALSVPPEQTPELLAGLIEKNKSLEKTGQRLATELARREGKELFLAAEPGPDGIRRINQRGPIDDAMRACAQAFVSGKKPCSWPSASSRPRCFWRHPPIRGSTPAIASRRLWRRYKDAEAAMRSWVRAVFRTPRRLPARRLCYAEVYDREYAPLSGWSRSVWPHLGSGVPMAPDGISIRHADTVDVKFVLWTEGEEKQEKVIALPHPHS